MVDRQYGFAAIQMVTTDWRKGQTVTLWKQKVLHLERKSSMHQCMLWTHRVESSFAVKVLGILTDDKLIVSQKHICRKGGQQPEGQQLH